MMTALSEKIGQMFMVGLSGEELTREELSFFKSYPFGGFILFSHNCHEPAQILSLCRSLWEIASQFPPFIAIDQEGGRVHRLPQPFSHFPAAGRIGEKGDKELAYRAGRATGLELALAGINLNFAPVLDVNSNPNNPIIGDRSFGPDSQRVIRFADKWLRGLRAGGIIPCGKHFPGHGDTDQDSHLDLPLVAKSLEQLQAVELPPFVHACQNQIESLMTAHVHYCALDAKFPATLSRNVLTGLLRQELGYRGVVFSDDMEMKAMSDNYGADEAVDLGVRAGIDVLLYCHERAKAMRAFDFLCAAAERDRAVRAMMEDSYRRIGELKRRYLKTFSGVAPSEFVKRLARLEHQRIVDEIQGSL